jgi:hypothetical protein
MATKTGTVEMAAQGPHGEWDHIGDYYDTIEAAVAAAVVWAAGDYVYHDDTGMAYFGISEDPASGHYEHRLAVAPDGSHTFVG